MHLSPLKPSHFKNYVHYSALFYINFTSCCHCYTPGMSLMNKYHLLWSFYWNYELSSMQGLTLADNTPCRRCRDVYLQTVMRFFRSTPTLRADAFFDVRPIAIAVWMQPDSIQRRPRGLFGIRAQARTPPSPPVSYKYPLSSAGSHRCCCCCCWRWRTGKQRASSS